LTATNDAADDSTNCIQNFRFTNATIPLWHQYHVSYLTSQPMGLIFASRMSLLEQSAMSSLSSPEVQQTMQGRKSFHFACGLGKIKVENDNIRAVEPCTDFIDTAQIRALITIHFNALSNSSNVIID
jgi:hypothetical protein